MVSISRVFWWMNFLARERLNVTNPSRHVTNRAFMPKKKKHKKKKTLQTQLPRKLSFVWRLWMILQRISGQPELSRNLCKSIYKGVVTEPFRYWIFQKMFRFFEEFFVLWSRSRDKSAIYQWQLPCNSNSLSHLVYSYISLSLISSADLIYIKCFT